MHGAYLVLAHRGFSQVERLIDALLATGGGVVVHVDSRVDPPRGFPTRDDRVVLLSERYATGWGSHEMVVATVALVREALRRFPDARYLSLLSGQDYPIKPPGYIASMLDRAESDFLPSIPLPEQERFRVDRYHWGRDLKGALAALSRRVPMPPRRFPIPRERLFRGSQWWSLRSETAASVLELLDRRPDVLDAFQRTYVPDEMLFQTAVVGFLRAPTVVDYNLRFLEFAPVGSRFGWGERTAPRVLGPDDLEALRASKALFARKFDTAAHPRILELVDDMVGRGS